MSSAAPKSTYSCPHCSYTVDVRYRLGEHFDKSHTKPSLFCSHPGCEASFHTRSGLDVHENGDHTAACPETGCPWRGSKRRVQRHYLTHSSQSHRLHECDEEGCLMRHDNQSSNKISHQRCGKRGCLVALSPKSMAFHRQNGPHLYQEQDVEKWKSLVAELGAGTGDVVDWGCLNVRDAYLEWYREEYPAERGEVYLQLHELLVAHRDRIDELAIDQGIETFSNVVKLLVMSPPHPASLALAVYLPEIPSAPLDFNPFFALPDPGNPVTFHDPSLTLSAIDVTDSIAEMERDAERVAKLAGLNNRTFRAVLHRQDNNCLVRRLVAYVLCARNPHHPRLFGPLTVLLRHSQFYSVKESVSETELGIHQVPKAYANSREDPTQQRAKIGQLLSILNINLGELCYLCSIPAVPRSALDGDIVARIGGFALLTAYGIRYESAQEGTLWSSPYRDDMQQHGISKWYLFSSDLGAVMGREYESVDFQPNTEEGQLLLSLTAECMHDLGIGELSTFTSLLANKGNVGEATDYSRLRVAVYKRMYLPRLQAHRQSHTGTAIALLPPESLKFIEKWDRFIRKTATERPADLRAKYGYTWWRRSDLLLLDFVWLLFGDFDGLQDVLMDVMPGKSDEALRTLLTRFPNHWRRMSREPEDLASFIVKYSLQDSYRILLSHPNLSARITHCDLTSTSPVPPSPLRPSSPPVSLPPASSTPASPLPASSPPASPPLASSPPAPVLPASSLIASPPHDPPSITSSPPPSPPPNDDGVLVPATSPPADDDILVPATSSPSYE